MSQQLLAGNNPASRVVEVSLKRLKNAGRVRYVKGKENGWETAL
jgi:hypothetical protein